MELELDSNKIVDITPLKNVKFKHIQILNLRKNKISNKENEAIISKLKSKIKGLYI